ncbi:hypothetical protein ACFT25_40805, partial [Streptomyces hydrogenans]
MLALALMASGASLSPVAAQAASGGRGLPELQKVTDVPAASTTPKGPAAPPDTTAKSELKAAPGVRWPAAASAEATVPKASASGRSVASAVAAGPSAKAGSLPVRLALGNKAVAKGASVPAADAPAVTAKVSVHGQD